MTDKAATVNAAPPKQDQAAAHQPDAKPVEAQPAPAIAPVAKP